VRKFCALIVVNEIIDVPNGRRKLAMIKNKEFQRRKNLSPHPERE
jgi:hypothetical protein